MPEPQVHLCVMADGAPWSWAQARAVRQAAVEMRDNARGSGGIESAN